jgi:hypothetical protein
MLHPLYDRCHDGRLTERLLSAIERGPAAMGFTLDLSPPLEEELTREAEREDVSLEEHVASLVRLALALTYSGSETALGQDVKTFLSERSIELDRVAIVLDEFRVSRLIQSAGRVNRHTSLMGRYAHLGVTSEDAARAKQEEIEIEERRFQ